MQGPLLATHYFPATVESLVSRGEGANEDQARLAIVRRRDRSGDHGGGCAVRGGDDRRTGAYAPSFSEQVRSRREVCDDVLPPCRCAAVDRRSIRGPFLLVIVDIFVSSPNDSGRTEL